MSLSQGTPVEWNTPKGPGGGCIVPAATPASPSRRASVATA